VKRIWHRVLDELGWPGLITLVLFAGPIAGFVLIWGVWPLYQRIGFAVLMFFIAILMGRERHREQRKRDAAEQERIKALHIVDRLEAAGQGLASATLEELRTIRRGLSAETGDRR
jgi:type VI protein secretion system component VasK